MPRAPRKMAKKSAATKVYSTSKDKSRFHGPGSGKNLKTGPGSGGKIKMKKPKRPKAPGRNV